MKPDSYSKVSEHDVQSLFLGQPDVEDQNIRFVQTTLGATALVAVYPAPSFCTAKNDANASYFSAPDRLEVVLSLQLRQVHQVVFDTICSQYQNATLLVRASTMPDWCNVGPSVMGPVLGANGVHWKYTYKLNQKLPYELWTQFGGYKNWLLAVGDEEHLCSNAGQCMGFVRVDWGKVADDLQINRYEGDSLLAVTNGQGECVVFHYKEDEFDDTSVNVAYRGSPNEKVTFYTSKGHDIVADASWIISKNAAMAIIEKFVATGDPGDMAVGQQE